MYIIIYLEKNRVWDTHIACNGLYIVYTIYSISRKIGTFSCGKLVNILYG